MTSHTGDACQSNESNNSFPIESLRFPLDNSLNIVFTGYFNGFNVEVKSPEAGALLYHMGCFGKGSASRSKPRFATNGRSRTILRRRQFLKRNQWASKFNIKQYSELIERFYKIANALNARLLKQLAERKAKGVKKNVIDLKTKQRKRNAADLKTKEVKKNVIDLVSSDEENGEEKRQKPDSTNSENSANEKDKQAKKNTIDLVSSDEENITEEQKEPDTTNTTSCEEILKPHTTTDVVVVVPDSDSEEEGGNYLDNVKPKTCINKIWIKEKLILTLQEAFFLVYGLGCLRIMHCDKPLSIKQCWDLFVKTDKTFIPKYVVYHYFRTKGYVVKPGIKFGGDYLLYKGGPETTHASYIVAVRTESMHDDWFSILGHVRMAGTTAKEVMIAEVIGPKTTDEQGIDSTTSNDLPEGLCHYTVREMVLSRQFPVSIKDDEE